MRWFGTCREVIRLMLEGEDRRLGVGERLVIRVHLGVCDACSRVQRQVAFMRRAMGSWRNYRQADPADED